MDDDERIRRKAHELWEGEGRPEGRADIHWTEAREIVALQDSMQTTLRPLAETTEEVVEPYLAVQNQADVPGLTDLGEDAAGPSLDNARAIANETPLSVDKPDPKKKRKRV